MKTTVRTGRSMGSPLRLTLAGARNEEADCGWSLVAATFARAEHELTRFDPSSALSQLNVTAGGWVAVPVLLRRALAASWRAFRLSGGCFDPRIIGALEAAGETAGVPLPPSPARLRPGDRWLELDPRGGRARVDAPIDLGGIGKGLALRWAAATLRRRGVRDFLLSAGGDMVASGRGPGGGPWVVGLEDPTGATRPLTTIALRDAALATSSVALHPRHLIDPATSQPAHRRWLSVTVLDADPAWAEIRSKVAFLSDREPRRLPPRTIWRVGPDGRLANR
jgi:thiamine biosynthesis lipoprotein